MIRAAFVLALMLAAGPAAAQGEAARAERLAAARALFGAMGVDKQFDQMSQVMRQAMHTPGVLKAAGPGGEKLRDLVFEETIAAVKDMTARPGGTIDVVIEAIADLYTLEELRELKAFYESPLGRKMVETQPQIARQTMEQMGRMQRELMPAVCRRVAERARIELPGPALENFLKACAP